MGGILQLLRTYKKSNNEELNKRILQFGEPLYLHNENKSDVALVIGDDKGTLIKDLPKFTPIPPTKEGDPTINNIYYIKQGDKYYLVDKDGNIIDIIGTGGGGGVVNTYTATLTQSDWIKDENVEGIYKQVIEIPQIEEKNSTTIDVKVDVISEYSDILTNWRYIIKAQTFDGGITFYAYKQPKRSLVFQAQVVSNLSEVLVQKSAIIKTEWQQEDNYYYQEIIVEGVKAINASTIDVTIDLTNYKEQLQQWSKIIRIDTEEGKIKIYASEPTNMELPITMFVYTLAEVK